VQGTDKAWNTGHMDRSNGVTRRVHEEQNGTDNDVDGNGVLMVVLPKATPFQVYTK